MNGKFEDKLAQLAFGDLSPEEGARLEKEVKNDPEALRALSLYKDMREGLRSLSDIPEDQFSKERLRDAILTQGLRPVPLKPASPRSWLWMPATACALGFGLMLTINFAHKGDGQTKIVMGPEISRYGISTEQPIKIAERAPDSKLGPIGPPHPIEASTVAVNEAFRRKDPDEVDPSVKALNNTGFEDDYDPDLGNFPTGVSRPTAGSSTEAIRSSSGSTSAPIILIEQDKDEQTGALKATEVGSSSNVLVGG